MFVPVVYGDYIYHHSKFVIGVSEYVSKSQKWPDRADVQCQNCYELNHRLDMRRIRRFLTPSVAKTIATSLIGSKLDYCNSVLFKEISKLQGVQNCLARVVIKSPRFCHITPLKSLHWLVTCSLQDQI